MITQSSVKTALNIEVTVSPLMTVALQRWSLMYENHAEWIKDGVESLNLPAAISGEFARAATIEMVVKIDGSARADYLNEQMAVVLPQLRGKLELCLAKGGMIFKPYPVEGRLAVDYVQAGSFFPVKFDSNGRITSCVFEDVRQVGKFFYTRMEYHDLQAGGLYMIKNVAFRSEARNDLGTQVLLTEIPDWAGLVESITYQNVFRPLFGYCKPPGANNIDTTSPLGVSCFSRAEKLVEQADKQWFNLIWEFESGKRAIDVDASMLQTDSRGQTKLPNKLLFRTWNSTAGSTIGETGPMFKDFTPEFREAMLKAGFNDILRQIEFNCNMSYGNISDPATVALTATEIVNSKQRYYSSVSDIQKELKQALEDLTYAMDIWASLYFYAPTGTYTSNYNFDDSIIADDAVQFSQDTQAVGLKAMPLYVWVMRNYDMTEVDAKKWVADAQAEQPAGITFPADGAGA